MNESNITLMSLRKDFETLQQLGAPFLACNAVMVIPEFPHLRLLFQNFQRPMVTNHDAADFDAGGGLQTHGSSIPKTNFENNVTAVETRKGALREFAEAIVVNYGGRIPKVIIYEGHVVNGGATITGDFVHELLGCDITFPDGGGDIDTTARSQVLQVQSTLRYNYFGGSSKLGTNGITPDLFASTLTDALKDFAALNKL